MKKIIYVFGVLFLSIVIILNILFTANLDASEHITISWNSFIYVIGLIVFGALLFIITKLVDKHLYNDDTETKKKRDRR